MQPTYATLQSKTARLTMTGVEKAETAIAKARMVL